MVVLAVVTLALGALWLQAQTFGKTAANTVAAANYTQQRVNRAVSDFTGDSKSASKLAPVVRDGEESVSDLRTRLQESRNAPFFGAAYRAKLDAYLDATGAYYALLDSTTSYVERRDKALAELGKAVTEFQQTLDANPSDARLLVAATRLERTAEAARSAIASAPAEVTPYSGDVLASYVSEIAEAGGTIRTGIKRKDVVSIMSGATQLAEVFKNDWGKAMVASDATGAREIDRLTGRVAQASARVTEAAGRYAAQTRSLGVAVLLLACAAALAAAYAYSHKTA